VSPALTRVRPGVIASRRSSDSRAAAFPTSCSGAFSSAFAACGCVALSYTIIAAVLGDYSKRSATSAAMGPLISVPRGSSFSSMMTARCPRAEPRAVRPADRLPLANDGNLEDLSAHPGIPFGDRDGHLVTDPRLRLAVLGAVSSPRR